MTLKDVAKGVGLLILIFGAFAVGWKTQSDNEEKTRNIPAVIDESGLSWVSSGGDFRNTTVIFPAGTTITLKLGNATATLSEHGGTITLTGVTVTETK